MIAFVRTHRVALLRVFLLATLVCVAYMGAAHTWRQVMPRPPGWAFLFGSMPWSLLWTAQDLRLSGAVPWPLRMAVDGLVVGLGFGLNVFLVVSVSWYVGSKVRRRESRTSEVRGGSNDT